MPPFDKLRKLRTFQRKLFPAIKTATDLDIVLEVGCAQESKRALGTKALFQANLGAPATISRRLERLKRLRVVEQRAAPDDRRRKHIILCAPILRRMNALLLQVRRILAE